MPDTNSSDASDHCDQWISVPELLDLMRRLRAAMSDDPTYEMDVLGVVIRWCADHGLMAQTGAGGCQTGPDPRAATIEASGNFQHRAPAEVAGRGNTLQSAADQPETAEEDQTGLLLGALSDDEKARIREMAAAGQSSHHIAERLRRRVQTVGLYMSRLPVIDAARAASGHPPMAPAPVAAALTAQAEARAAAPTEENPQPVWWRAIEASLNALGNRGPWSRALDLALVEGLAMGKPAVVLADELGVEVGQIKPRYIALTPDGPSIEYQTRLLKVLRARAGVA